MKIIAMKSQNLSTMACTSIMVLFYSVSTFLLIGTHMTYNFHYASADEYIVQHEGNDDDIDKNKQPYSNTNVCPKTNEHENISSLKSYPNFPARGGSSSESEYDINDEEEYEDFNIFTNPNLPIEIDPNYPMTPAEYESVLQAKQRQLKAKRRKQRKSQSQSQSKQDSKKSHDGLPNNLGLGGEGAVRKVSTVIPGYGKVEGRRESGIDIWRGIPYAVSIAILFFII